MSDTFSDSASSQAASDAQVRADIDSAEAFTAGTVNGSRSWDANVKAMFDDNRREVAELQQLNLKSAQAYADLDLERARRAQTMWENTYKELLTDQSEIRRRAMNQFDAAVNVANAEAHRTIRDGDSVSARKYSVNQVAAQVKEILTEDQPFKDALATQVIQAIAGMAKKEG